MVLAAIAGSSAIASSTRLVFIVPLEQAARSKESRPASSNRTFSTQEGFPMTEHRDQRLQGRAHDVGIGDRPPAKASSKEVRVNAAPAQADATARDRQQKMTEFLEQQQKEREERQAKEAKVRQQAEKQEELCRNLQARLKHLESVSTFYDINENGEREYVSEEENQQIRDRFRAKVKETCGE